MFLNFVFLISSIVTLTVITRRRMLAATVLYTMLIGILTLVLLFTLEVDVIRLLMSGIFGEDNYILVHDIFSEAIATPIYGVFIVGAIALTLFVQIAVMILYPIHAIVCYLTKNTSVYQKFKKAYVKFVYSVRRTCVPTRINLLYCRMLN